MYYTTTQIAEKFNVSNDKAYFYAQKFEPNTTNGKYKHYYSEDTVNKIAEYIDFHKKYIGTIDASNVLNVNNRNVYYWVTHNMISSIKRQVKTQIKYYIKREDVNKLKAIAETTDLTKILPLSQIMLKLNLTKKESLQIVKKYDIKSYTILGNQKEKYYNIDDFKNHTNAIEKLQQKRRGVSGQSFVPTNGKKDLTQVPLVSIAHNLDINPKVLYAMASRNKIPSIKDMKTKQITTDINTAKYLKDNYLNYPKDPIYTVKDLSEKYNVTPSNIKSAMYHGDLQLIHILGDSHKYVTTDDALKIKQILKVMTYRSRKSKSSSLIKNTSAKVTKNDVTMKQLSQRLQCKPNNVGNWVKNQWVPYHYNGTDIFFTPNDVKSIRKQYLNYPNEKCVNKKLALQLTNLTSNPPKFNRYCDKFGITNTKVLGDNQKLYKISDIRTLNQAIQKFEQTNN